MRRQTIQSGERARKARPSGRLQLLQGVDETVVGVRIRPEGDVWRVFPAHMAQLHDVEQTLEEGAEVLVPEEIKKGILVQKARGPTCSPSPKAQSAVVKTFSTKTPSMFKVRCISSSASLGRRTWGRASMQRPKENCSAPSGRSSRLPKTIVARESGARALNRWVARRKPVGEMSTSVSRWPAFASATEFARRPSRSRRSTGHPSSGGRGPRPRTRGTLPPRPRPCPPLGNSHPILDRRAPGRTGPPDRLCSAESSLVPPRLDPGRNDLAEAVLDQPVVVEHGRNVVLAPVGQDRHGVAVVRYQVRPTDQDLLDGSHRRAA